MGPPGRIPGGGAPRFIGGHRRGIETDPIRDPCEQGRHNKQDQAPPLHLDLVGLGPRQPSPVGQRRRLDHVGLARHQPTGEGNRGHHEAQHFADTQRTNGDPRWFPLGQVLEKQAEVPALTRPITKNAGAATSNRANHSPSVRLKKSLVLAGSRTTV